MGKETDRQAIMAAFHGLLAAAESGDPQGYVGWLTDDAVMMHAGRPAVVGREANLSFIRDWLADYTFRLDPWHLEEIRVEGSLALLRYSGIATITPKHGGQSFAQDRKYIEILRREGDSWKFSHHIYNMNE